MKICPNCRDTMVDSKKFCPTCHYEFSDESIKAIEEKKNKVREEQKKTDKHVFHGISILTILVIIDLIFAVISLFVDNFTFGFGLLNSFAGSILGFGTLIIPIIIIILNFIICFVILSKLNNTPLGIKIYCLLIMSIPLGVLLLTTDPDNK